MIEVDEVTRAETAAFVAEIERLAGEAPSSHTLPVEQQRTNMALGAEPRLAHAREERIAGVPVRVLEADNGRGTYLHIHGGGWTMGSNAFQDQRLWKVASDVGVRVVSVDYRLAPEHPFPACIDDCLAVASELADHGDGGPLLIGGESAGAHLSALVLTALGPSFAGANLVYGCYDLALTDFARSWGERNVILSTPIVQWHADQLLAGLDADARRDPSISPLYADLSAVPPALLTVGTDDPLYHDSVLLAARWPGARLDVYPGGFHAFDFFDLELARLALGRQVDFLLACVHGGP
jgi:acetyl esterase/lipase